MERLVRGIKGAVSAPPVATPKPAASHPPVPGRRRPPWKAIVAAALLGLVVLGVIVYVATDKGRIRIVVNDPKAVVKVDGDAVGIEALGAPLTFRPGVHELEVQWGDGEFKTRTFVVRRGDNEDLRVEYEPASDRVARASPEKPPDVTPNQPPPPPAKVERAPEPVPAPAPEVVPKEIINSIGMKLVLIPAGEFPMGSPDSDPDADTDEKPQHPVRITRPFYMGATEVTQGQYEAVTGADPSHFKGSDDLPVETVSWLDAINYCNALSRKEGLPPFYRVQAETVEVPDGNGPGYRLPTEAEWECACRAGSWSRYCFGEDAAGLAAFAWYEGNAGGQTHPVGQKRSNAWGLYDMHGNVWEWCWDGYEADYYSKKPPATDPLGPSQADSRVYRGGSWFYTPLYCRSALRGGVAPGYRNSILGFRVARVQSVR
jgi:formylglycine-generating enzyme required for sulfatase activity